MVLGICRTTNTCKQSLMRVPFALKDGEIVTFKELTNCSSDAVASIAPTPLKLIPTVAIMATV